MLIGVPYDNLGLPETEDVDTVMGANIDANRSPKNGFRMIYYAIKNDKLIYMFLQCMIYKNQRYKDGYIVGE